jgi:GDPmannose 4,6-dehydratase
MKTALVTGITGQDGRHLAELLLGKNYKVFGIVNGQRRDKAEELALALPSVQQIYGDLTDNTSIITAIQESQPDEIYNLGAISFVGLSFSQPELTADVTGLGILRILEACRTLNLNDKVRIYQASSSEMFGKVRETPQTESTPFHPRSPYGVAKAFAHYAATNYREAYGMFVSNGILFNHEGEYRGYEFVTRKITQGVARIRLGLSNELRLGSLDPRRDWGYAGDYVEAMWKMLQVDSPDDFVIATGETHSVREFLSEAFLATGIEEGEARYVSQDPRFLRPSEVDLLIGDYSKAKSVLGWSPKKSFPELVRLMVKNDLILEATKAGIEIPKTPVTG